jgi:hypothetical protein
LTATMSTSTPSTAVGVFSNSNNLLVWGRPSWFLVSSFSGNRIAEKPKPRSRRALTKNLREADSASLADETGLRLGLPSEPRISTYGQQDQREVAHPTLSLPKTLPKTSASIFRSANVKVATVRKEEGPSLGRTVHHMRSFWSLNFPRLGLRRPVTTGRNDTPKRVEVTSIRR